MGMHHLAAIMEPVQAVQHRLLNPPSEPFPPANIRPPTVYGLKIAGETLICLVGSWNGSDPITYTFQWLKNGAPMSGATNFQYLVQVSDVSSNLSCVVTAHNAAASVSVTSQVI